MIARLKAIVCYLDYVYLAIFWWALVTFVATPVLDKIFQVGLLLVLIQLGNEKAQSGRAVSGYTIHFVLCVMICWILLKYSRIDLVWLILIGIVSSLYLSIQSDGAFRLAAVYVIWFFVVVLVIELWLMQGASGWNSTRSSPRVELGYVGQPGGYGVPDDELGYRLPAGYRIHQSVGVNGIEIYEEEYNINSQGWREYPEKSYDHHTDSLALFGGSYAFGQGVADNETTAALVHRLSGRGVQVENFAVSGWGSHQMLRLLELGRERSVLSGRNVVAGVYLAIADHARRAGGLSDWDRKGPMYDLGTKGGVEYLGNFESSRLGKALSLLARSRAGREIILPALVTDDHRELNVHIVRRAAEIFEKRYGAPLIVLYLPDRWVDGSMVSEMQSLGLSIHLADSVLTESENLKDKKYFYSDNHPNALAHRVLGEQILRILKPLVLSKGTTTVPEKIIQE